MGVPELSIHEVPESFQVPQIAQSQKPVTPTTGSLLQELEALVLKIGIKSQLEVDSHWQWESNAI